MRLFGLLILLSLVPKTEATSSNYHTLADCEREALQCIAYTEQALTSVEKQSVHWYHLKNLNLSAHFQLAHLDELAEEVPSLALITDAPAVFRVTVLTIYSKLLINAGDTAKGEETVREAIRLIREVNAVSLSPDRYAELIVLLNYLQRYDEAEAAGIEILSRLERTRRVSDLGDLYTAVAHTEYFQGKFIEARRYYEAALEGYTKHQHVLEISNTLHNIARTHQAQGQFEQSIPIFEQALMWKTRDSKNRDLKNEQYTRMRLAESLLKVGRFEQAREELGQIDVAHILAENQSLFDELSDAVSQPNNLQVRK